MKNPPESIYLSDRDFFSAISESELGRLGVGDVAYVKRHLVGGQAVFVLYAADGTALAAQKNAAAAESSAYDQDLDLVTVH